MTDSIASPWNATGGVTPGVIDSSGNVSSDLPCRKCAYNLRGLPSGGRCPECGTAVGFSVQGDLLRFCDPDWVDTLRNGAVCMLSGIGVIVLAVILNAVISAGRIAAGGTGAHLNAATFVSLMGAGLLLIGSWLLTSPDPSGLG
ncbi:MAG TPA: hypothetical protein VHS31_09000, partial [Tepidisphaeraceae bacterium]|nr:hypothetical protein [Tepidisphaeraceae bacterium]